MISYKYTMIGLLFYTFEKKKNSIILFIIYVVVVYVAYMIHLHYDLNMHIMQFRGGLSDIM